MNDYMKAYREWCEDPFFDEATRTELKAISGDEKEIEDRFYDTLKFGTAGLRGILGAGTNRMNRYTVGAATQGLANYIIKQGGQERGVVIAHDCRHMSPEFAQEAGLVLAANGIKAYVFDSLRPTPELSFAVRYLNCIAGINITASHNPAAYNGYKVYWEDGAQITPPHDTGIMDEVAAITSYHDIRTTDREQAEKDGLYHTIGEEVDKAYDACIDALVLDREAIKRQADELTIVFTPLHGTGNLPVRRNLEKLGFNKVLVVPEQELPDGDFPTAPYPNPETPQAFELALELGRKEQADILLATDPDADRLGVYVRDAAGEYHPLTGNMSGCLMEEYLLAQRKQRGLLPQDAFVVRTIVSTKLADAIAEAYDTELVEVLTGFKYIGEKILEAEKSGHGHYQFGFEESYGSLAAGYARDKDAVGAAVILCEMAAYYRDKGETLWDAMVAVFEKYGWYREEVTAVSHEGVEGRAKIEETMKNLREAPPESIGDYRVTAVRDYQTGIRREIGTDNEEAITLPKSNVLYYELEDGAWACVRPSGTEPKIKVYFGIRAASETESAQKTEEMKRAVEEELLN